MKHEACGRVGLFVDMDPDGGFFTDSGRWYEIALSGQSVADNCKVGRIVAGGAGSAGEKFPTIISR